MTSTNVATNSDIRVMFANILTDPFKIGTRVLDFEELAKLTSDAIKDLRDISKLEGRGFATPDVEFEIGAAEGHFNLTLKGALLERGQKCVSCGDGKHTNDPNDYVIRKHWSGSIMTCLKRSLAAKATTVKLIIQTKDAYLRDPDMLKDSVDVRAEKFRVETTNPTHIVIWVVASASTGTMPSGTFIRNLAGFNEDAMKWDADEIRKRAKECFESDKTWCVVAD